MKKAIIILTLVLISGLAISWVVNAVSVNRINQNFISQNNWEVYETPVFDGINRAYYPTILKVNKTYRMWYTDEKEGLYSVGYTTSKDGLTWGEPTMVNGLTGQPNHAVVVNIGKESQPYYRIWYADASVWPYVINLFRTAESEDGINWTNDEIMHSDPPFFTHTWPSDCFYGSYGPGAVLYNPKGYAKINDNDPMGNKYVMYYNVYTWCQGTTEGTALAYSADGINWKRYGTMPVIMAEGDNNPSAWDAGYLYAWTVLKLKNSYQMWYSGGILDSNDGIGYAYSEDGINWIKDTENPVLHVDDADAQIWRKDRTFTPLVLKEGNSYKMWFSARDGETVGSNSYVIGYATLSISPLTKANIFNNCLFNNCLGKKN